MASPFKTIDQLLLAILISELDRRNEGGKLDQIQADITEIKADVKAIRDFIGAPDPGDQQAEIDAAAAAVDAVTAQLKQSSDKLSQAIQTEQNP